MRNPTALSLFVIVALCAGIRAGEPAREAVISELMAVNVFTLDDDESDSSDWFEVRNESAAPLDLGGWYVSDDVDLRTKYRIPDGVTLEPGGHLLVFASGKNRAIAGRPLHTGFRLTSSGEALILVRPDGDTIEDAYLPAYPGQFQDVSYGIPAGGGDRTYLDRATPGAVNSGPGSPGPVIAGVAHEPRVPLASEGLVVTARVTELLAAVANVALRYRVLYAAESAPVAMRDDGIEPDLEAGDGIFTARIPASAFSAGDMVRWKITASDVEGSDSTSPLFPDPQSSPEYHGTVVRDPTVDSNLPVLSWFLRPGTEGAANSRRGTRASIAFLDAFYDNVFVRIRGGSTSGLAKKSYKFDLNPKHHFRFMPEAGRVSEFNLNTTYTDKTYLRQPLSYEVYDRAGVPGSECFLVRVERNGSFFSVAAFTEQPDDDLLRREGLDDAGALYKMFNTFTSGTSRVEKKNRRWESNQDLSTFVSRMNSLSGMALRNYVFDSVDVPSVLSYLAANALTQHNDSMAKNYYLYRDSEGSGEWLVLPWDVDLTWGRHYMTNDNILGDPIWANQDWVLGGASRNVPISPSHPFMGMQELPGNRSWNRLTDALLEVPEFAEMLRRRLRTLMDEIYESPVVPLADRELETRLDALAGEIEPDVLLDVARWGQFGQRQTIAQALTVLKRSFLEVHRRHLYATHAVENADVYNVPQAFSARIPPEQRRGLALEIGAIDVNPSSANQDEEFIELRNPNDVAVDISSWALTGAVEHVFRKGTVVLAGASIHVSPDVATFRARETPPTGGEGLLVQGDYAGHLSSFGETICLVDAAGDEVDCLTYEGDPSDAQRYLRVTELQYHPADPSPAEDAAGFASASLFEFIELVNTSTEVTLDLDGVRISEGVEFEFAGGQVTALAPGEVVLVVADLDAFTVRYGAGLPVAGDYGPFRLDNDGETIKLDDATGSTIQSFRYDDDVEAGWPAAADGTGASIEVIDVAGEYDDPANWIARAGRGSPGVHRRGSAVTFIRGDANLDGGVDLSDGVAILLYLFGGGAAECLDAADATDDELINLTDAIRVLDWLFRGGDALPPPFPLAGEDETGDGELGCEG